MFRRPSCSVGRDYPSVSSSSALALLSSYADLPACLFGSAPSTSTKQPSNRPTPSNVQNGPSPPPPPSSRQWRGRQPSPQTPARRLHRGHLRARLRSNVHQAPRLPQCSLLAVLLHALHILHQAAVSRRPDSHQHFLYPAHQQPPRPLQQQQPQRPQP